MPFLSRRSVELFFLAMVLGIGTMLWTLGAAFGQSDAQLSEPNNLEPIYSDTVAGRVLLNGWQNWSYDTDLTYDDQLHVRAGSPSIGVTIKKTGGAFYLHRQAFDARLYSALTFWVNGGPAGGQHLQIRPLLSGTAQSGVPLPPLMANKWTPITLPLSSLAVADKRNLDGFWVQRLDGPEKQPATFYISELSLTQARPPDSVMIHVDPSLGPQVDDRLFGLNTAFWDSRLASQATEATLADLNVRALRFPGGSAADEFHWSTQASRSSFDTFAALANGLRASAMVTVNYGSGTAHEAAAWVRYANITRHDGIRYWEIGNEVWGDWETDQHKPPHDADAYGRAAADYITQMRSVDPTIKVGVALFYGDGPQQVVNNQQMNQQWNKKVLDQLKNAHVVPDFVTQHKYPQDSGLECDLMLLTGNQWAAEAQELRGQLNAAFGKDGGRVEMLLTESNSVPKNPGKQTTSVTEGLFLADTLGQVLGSEYSGLYWWALRNGVSRSGPQRLPLGSNDGSLFGWRLYGDFGLMDDDGRDFDLEGGPTRYPAYYVMELLSQFARGNDRVLRVATNSPWLSAYAVTRSDGALRLLVINKSSTANILGQVRSPGGSPTASMLADVYQYGMAQDSADRSHAGATGVVHNRVPLRVRSPDYLFPKYSVTLLIVPRWFGSL